MTSKMNLNRNPSPAQLASLFRECNDSEGTHALWINYDGDVIITLLPCGVTPAQWKVEMGEKILFGLESYAQGNGYVGPEAADDDQHVQKTFKEILGSWQDYCGAK